jgi:hypothetical protein
MERSDDPRMTTKEALHQLVDSLPDGALDAAERHLRALQTDDPVVRAHLLGPLDDEAETEEERRAVDEARADLQAGRVVSMDQIKREFGV